MASIFICTIVKCVLIATSYWGKCTTTLKDEASITPIREQAVSDRPPSMNKSVKLKCLCPLTTDAAGQLDVLGHNSNTLS
eukprot:scaffold8855_cov50-Cyclotella_meneghiniana.AAC.1